MRFPLLALTLLLGSAVWARGPAPQGPLTKDQMKGLWQQRDPFCGTGDPWQEFAARPKTGDEVRFLREWADDASDDASGAFFALRTEQGPDAVEWWRQRLSRTKRGDAHRAELLGGLLSAGGEAVIDETFQALGESDAVDVALFYSATGSLGAGSVDKKPPAKAVSRLREYVREHPDCKIAQDVRQFLVSRDPEHSQDEAEDRKASPLLLTATVTKKSARAIRVSLRVKNVSKAAVSVQAFPAPGGGFVPSQTLWFSLGERSLDAPSLSDPVTKKLAPGAVTTGTVDVQIPPNQPTRGLLSVAFTPEVPEGAEKPPGLTYLVPLQ